MGLICFNNHKWFSVSCSVLFWISALFYIALGFVFLRDEKSNFRELKNSGGASTSNEPNVVKEVEVKQNQEKV